MSEKLDSFLKTRNEKRQAELDAMDAARLERERVAKESQAIFNNKYNRVIEPFFKTIKKQLEADDFNLSFTNNGSPSTPRYQYTVTVNSAPGVQLQISFYNQPDKGAISINTSYKRGSNTGNEPYMLTPDEITNDRLEGILLLGMNQAFM